MGDERAERKDTLQFLFAKAFESAIPDDTCPAPHVILAGWQRRLPADDLDALLLHLGGCPVCAEAWRLAERVGEETA